MNFKEKIWDTGATRAEKAVKVITALAVLGSVGAAFHGALSESSTQKLEEKASSLVGVPNHSKASQAAGSARTIEDTQIWGGTGMAVLSLTAGSLVLLSLEQKRRAEEVPTYAYF